VYVQWLDLVFSVAAAGGFILASLNGLYFADYARTTPSRARRAGAAALTLVEAGLALEALLFLSQAPPAAPSWTRSLAVLAVRGMHLASTALVSLLIWRGVWQSRR
jgi:hypothetical protein